jgi:DNA-binding transcriptional LysR family regulator
MSAQQLDHRLLRQFLAVVDAGTLRGAAQQLNISQPPLTQTIRKLEDGLGTSLFVREPKGMVPTTAGRLLADEARALLARLERAERRVRATAEEAAPLRIGFVSAALNGTLPSLLRRTVEQERPRPVLREMTTPEQLVALSDGTLDLGLLHPPVAIDDLAQVSFGRDPFVAAVPTDYRLAHRASLRFADIAAEPIVMFPREQGPSLYAAIERCAFEAGHELDVVATAPRVHSQLAIVSSGLGVGLVAKSLSETLTFASVTFVPIADTADRLFLELVLVGERSLLTTIT